MADINVLIVGSGPGALVLACAFERANIKYQIYERCKASDPIMGGAIYLNANVMPLLAQLSLLDDIESYSKPCPVASIFSDDLREIGAIAFEGYAKRYGYVPRIIAHNDLVRVLMSRIPPHKIIYGKRVVRLSQQETSVGVFVTTADDAVTKADIVVGADGYLSQTRQCLYRTMASQNRLPRVDLAPTMFSGSCIVGTTEPLIVEQYPQVTEARAHFDLVIGGRDTPFSWFLFTLPGNRVAYGIVKDFHQHKQQRLQSGPAFQSLAWDSEHAYELAQECRNFPTSLEGSLGHLIAQTRPESMAKVLLEQRLYETWFDGRIVLLGDAVHKHSPSSGQGTGQAMLDAVSLASCLNDLEANTERAIHKAFTTYRAERYEIARDAVSMGRNFASLFHGKTPRDVVARTIVLKMPDWIKKYFGKRLSGSKPQVTFLPFAEDRGMVKHSPPQKYSSRMASALLETL